MKKVIGIIIALVVAIAVGALVTVIILNKGREGDSRIDNDKAEKDTKNRYLTIINETDEVINEVYITVGDGTEIEHGYQKNPDEDSFSVKIPKQYEEYDKFTITFVDRYGFKYEKTIDGVKDTGRTEVVVSEDDYVKQKGDWKKNVDKWFNKD